MFLFRKIKYNFRVIGSFSFVFSVFLYFKFFVVSPGPYESHVNYFQNIDADRKWSYLVNTSNCKIVAMSEWDYRIKGLYQRPYPDDPRWPFECHKRSIRHWTYVENSILIINETALQKSGYSLESVACCYKTITRVEQSYQKFDASADNEIKFSTNCYPMQQRTKVAHEFFRVICSSKYFPVPIGVLYKQFHAIPLPDIILPQKMNFWKENKKNRPPNIILFGIDTMSRLNFRRSMPKTKAVLENNGAVEMMGYTKGENTWPNLAVLLSGYKKSELLKLCKENVSDTRHDFCPYIWKDFAKANYAIALIEDRIDIAAFNFFMMGFIKKPVDFYFRPFMLGVYDHQPYQQMKKHPKVNAMDCVGHKTTDRIILEYNEALSNLSIPIFSFTWNINLAHEDMTAPRNVDDLYFDYFKKQLVKNNTIFFFVSDHGARSGNLRRTLPGWYEDKLPNLWIHMSGDLRERYPDWYKHLNQNSRKLVSPYDLHQTIIHLLEWFTHVRISREPVGKPFFLPIPDRTCHEAKIESEFCPCSIPKMLSVYDPKIQIAAVNVLGFLNKKLPDQCVSLHVGKITAGAIMSSINETSYIVTFFAQPGDIFIEANVKYSLETGLFDSNTELTRLNKMSRHVDCIKDSKLEKFCYCL